MAKKNLGGGPYRIKVGNDSWDKDLRSDITDVTSTLLPDGYFTGEHTIFADRDPTVEDTSATLYGSTINFESRKWRWVNNITKEEFSFKELVNPSDNVTNGGLDTDWINPTSGLAESWSDRFGYEGTGYTYSIVTGNGFVGNAQRVDVITNSYTAGFLSDEFSVVPGMTYTLHFKYRSNKQISIYDANVVILGVKPSSGGVVSSSTITFTPSGDTTQIEFRITGGTQVGDYVEIDEVYYTADSYANWEKTNDITLASTSADDGSVFISDNGELLAVNTTSGFVYVDGSRVDEYTPNGSIFLPYKTLKDVVDAGFNNCTVVLNEGTYDSGESIILPDSMNLIGTSIDNTFIAADITFTNSGGSGQSVRFIRFSGNVTQAVNSWAIYERCYFTGVGTTFDLGGAKCSLKDSTFLDTIGSVTLNNDELYVFNCKFQSDVTVTGALTTMSDCIVEGILTHDVGGGTLILNSVQLENATSFVSNVTGNLATPILLSGVAHYGTMQFNDAYAVLSNTLALTGAAITGNNITVNLLSGSNTVEYVPTGPYNPATKKYVDDNSFTVSGNENEVLLSDGAGGTKTDAKLIYDGWQLQVSDGGSNTTKIQGDAILFSNDNTSIVGTSGFSPQLGNYNNSGWSTNVDASNIASIDLGSSDNVGVSNIELRVTDNGIDHYMNFTVDGLSLSNYNTGNWSNDNLITKGYADANYGGTTISGNNNEILISDGAGGVKTEADFYFDGNRLTLAGTNNSVAIGLVATQTALPPSSVFIGTRAGEVTTGYSNTFIGAQAGQSNTTGVQNVYIGYTTGYNATGDRNVFIGMRAGQNETGSDKLYIENSTSTTPLIYGEFDNDKLVFNTAADLAQLAAQPTGSVPLAIATTQYVDDNAGGSISGADNEILISDGAGATKTSPNFTWNDTVLDVSITGNNVLITNSMNDFIPGTLSGNNHTVLGAGAGVSMTNPAHNTFIGTQAGQNVTDGGSNTFIGRAAGLSVTTGVGNVFIGKDAGANETGSNKLYIENTNSATPLIYGEFDNDTLIFNTSADLAKLSAQPTGAEPLAIATTQYVDDSVVESNVKLYNINKTYSATSEYTQVYPQLDIPELTQGQVGPYAHVAFPIASYNPTNGNILLCYREGLQHDGGPSAIYSKLSTDGGVTFGASEVVVPISGTIDYRNHCCACTPTGRFILTYEKYLAGTPGIFYVYTDDDGVSWSSEQAVTNLPAEYTRHVPAINNDILIFDDGSIGMTFYSINPTGVDRKFQAIMISHDNGSTFSEHRGFETVVGTVDPEQRAGEPTMVQLSDNTILCICRDSRNVTLNYMYQYISFDYGNTWTYQGLTDFDSSDGSNTALNMLPRLTRVTIFDETIIGLYYTHREENKVKRIFGKPKELMKPDGHLSWYDETLVDFYDWVLGQTVDGNGSVLHPNGSFRGMYTGEDQSSGSSAIVKLFETPNDMLDVALKMGIEPSSTTLHGITAPDFKPYFAGQTYINTVSNVLYVANDTSSQLDWIAQGSGQLDPYTALVSGSVVTWDASSGLNKTLTRGGNFTLTISNLTNGMSGDLRLNITSTTDITLSTGVTNSGNGDLTGLAVGIYHLAWIFTGTNFDYNISAYA